MDTKNISDEPLLNFLDGTVNDAERKYLIDILSKNPSVKNRLRELESIHHFLQNQKGIESPSKNFTEKVMSGLHTSTSFNFLSPKNGLILLIGLMVASVIAMALLSVGAFDNWHTLIGVNQIPLKTDLLKMPSSVPFDTKLVVKIFVMLNLILGLILLDRTILRPIFQKRAERFGL
ncbi:MAG: hypothetical protein QM734_13140 [Cyclobacteriaceae bacterium]